MDDILLDDMIANRAKNENVKMPEELDKRVSLVFKDTDLNNLRRKNIRKDRLSAAVLALVMVTSVWFSAGYVRQGVVKVVDRLEYFARNSDAYTIEGKSYVVRKTEEVKKLLDENNIESTTYIEGTSGVIVTEYVENEVNYRIRIFLSEKEGEDLYEIYINAKEPFDVDSPYIALKQPLLNSIVMRFYEALASLWAVEERIDQISISTEYSFGGSGSRISDYNYDAKIEEEYKITNLAIANGKTEINISNLPEELLEDRLEWRKF